MATQTVKKAKRPKPKTTSNTAKSRVVTSNKKKQSRLSQLFGSKAGLLIAAVLIGGVGAYLLSSSHADPIQPDDPARGLYYSSMPNGGRPDTSGPCAGMLPDTSKGQTASNVKSCIHVDPGPEGVDVRVRAKQVESHGKAQVQYDRQHPDNGSTEPGAAGANSTNIATPNDLYAGTLSNVSGNTWPCSDWSGTNRVTVMYAYPKGQPNRLGSLRDNFTAYIRRTNAIMYNSSVAGGGQPRQIKFTHDSSDCSRLIIPALEVDAGSTASAIAKNMSSISYIASNLRAQGYDKPLAKFLVYVDYDGGCGQAELRGDSQPGQANANNTGNEYSLIWKGCWDYAEPHELMHNLGAVQLGAPYATAPHQVPTGAKATDGTAVPSGIVGDYLGGFHCVDQHDVMCYDDDDYDWSTKNSSGTWVKHHYEGPTYMRDRCGATASYSLYDCGDDTYFSTHAPVAGSWLSTHWNVANSAYLTRY